MKFKFTCFLLIFSISIHAFAQEYCKKTVVNFDFGRYNLTADAKKKLNDLIQAHKEGQFLIELSGHTDSVNTEEFNLKLSKRRIQSVKEYIQRRIKAKIYVNQWPHGELKPAVPNTSDQNMAQNRRVEIYLTARTEQQLTFKGDNDATVSIKNALSDSCSICESNPKVTSYYNDQEAESGGVSLNISDNKKLSIRSAVKFDLNCEAGSAPACFPLSAKLDKASQEECLSAWIKSGGAWQRADFTVTKDTAGPGLIFTMACYKPGSWLALGHPTYKINGEYISPLCSHKINYSNDVEVLAAKISQGDSTMLNKGPIDTFALACDNPQIFAWALSGAQPRYAKGDLSNYQSSANDLNDNCDKLHVYQLDNDDFKVVPTSDTTVQIKAKGFDNVSKVGFYLEELDLLLPIANLKKTTYEGNYLNYDHKLRLIGDNNTYDLSYNEDRIKTKYKKGKQTLKIKIKKKKL